jgi:hypothetical protein
MIFFPLALICTKADADINIKIIYMYMSTYIQTMGQASSQYRDTLTVKRPKIMLVKLKKLKSRIKKLGLLIEKMS